MRAFLSIAIAFTWTLVVGACATQVHTEVTSFHSLPDVPRGKTFIVLPYKDQEGSLEWQSYANLVARRLEKYGLVRASTPTGVDLAVFLRYAVDGGRTTTSTVPIVGQTSPATSTTTTGYVGGRPISTTSYTPATYGVTGYQPVEDTVYGRGVKLVIVDVRRTQAEGKPATIYEATGLSSGSNSNLNVVMPYILDGMFIDWPGVPGSTVQRSVPMRE